MEQVARRESHAQAPGVLHDAETGLTFDGHAIDFVTGKVVGAPRDLSAASKESLDISLLVKAVQGDRIAQLAVSPTGNPADAIPVALDRLRRKIDSYRDFDERYPGFGGFLPWFRIDGPPGRRKMEPLSDWKDRIPALDNGQLAWSVYHAASALKAAGYRDLAAKYDAHLKLMSKHVVGMFFDPVEQTIRAEARIVGPNRKAPNENRYVTNPDNLYYLNDSSEGLLMVHFADLFGTWAPAHARSDQSPTRTSAAPSPSTTVTAHTDAVKFDDAPSARDALWTIPRHIPATFVTRAGSRITTERGWRFSSHEEWGYLMLPFRDIPIANALFVNAQRARTAFAADEGRPGLYASTHLPQVGNASPLYENRMGIPSIATEGTEAMSVYAPYAAFPLALVDKNMFATWMKNMLSAPRMFGEHGIGESFDGAGNAIAPVLTWDGKALPLLAWSGGISSDVRAALQRDGKYDRFLATVAAGYRRFTMATLEGANVPLSPPSAGVPRAMSDFSRSP